MDNLVNNPFSKVLANQSFARDQQDSLNTSLEQTQYHLMNQTHQKLEQTILKYGLSLNHHKEEDLKGKLNQSMLELDLMNKKMMNSLKGGFGSGSKKQFDDDEEEQKETYIQDFANTRGYNQSQQMYSQIRGTQQQPFNYFEANKDQIQEEEQESELAREEVNVFEQNMSEGSESKGKNQENAKEYPSGPQPIQFVDTFNKKKSPVFHQTEQNEDTQFS